MAPPPFVKSGKKKSKSKSGKAKGNPFAKGAAAEMKPGDGMKGALASHIRTKKFSKKSGNKKY